MSNSNKYVLIVEKNSNGLTLNENAKIDQSGNKQYLLNGIFTEFDIVNRNERVYTADKFLPHLNELVERKNSLGVVYGELDHPDVFDTSMQRVSHIIEKATYNKEHNRVDGEIRLLNTHWGKEAKAIVEDRCPLFVSSRAAGITESNGTVTVKKLFTYDIVADPGFGSARMSLNESLGFKAESNFRVYDVSDESKINELFNMNNNDFVTKNQMLEYSEYLKAELDKVKVLLNESVKTGVAEPTEIHKIAESIEILTQQQNKVNRYLEYLGEKFSIVVNENKELKTTTEKLVKHNNYITGILENTIEYTEHIGEKLDQNIEYSKYIAETLDKTVDFSEYVAEHVNKTIVYADYIAEQTENSIEYTQYIGEKLDKNINYMEYIAENLDKNIEYYSSFKNTEIPAECFFHSIIFRQFCIHLF